jgi:hypothetical protein
MSSRNLFCAQPDGSVGLRRIPSPVLPRAQLVRTYQLILGGKSTKTILQRVERLGSLLVERPLRDKQPRGPRLAAAPQHDHTLPFDRGSDLRQTGVRGFDLLSKKPFPLTKKIAHDGKH